MLLQLSVAFILFLSTLTWSPLHNERRQIIGRVGNHLRQSDGTTRRVLRTTPWLENSNKIGFGYNLLSGSPVCYTGECQMAGFTRSIFKLNYTSPVPGSCTNKLVPNNVDLDCIPTTLTKSSSEIIDTVEQLQKSTSNKVQFSIGAKFKGVEFSYEFSKETRFMLDNIVKQHQTSIFTTAQLSYVKLSMFEPKMELSDNFKYVIENMPCCEEDDLDIEEYIVGFIFDYYGFTYVTSILLGGVAQQNIFINREAKQSLERQDIDIKHEAKVKFDKSWKAADGSVEAGTSVSNSVGEAKFKNFSKEINSIYSSTLGGNLDLTTLAEWSKSVASNPVIVEFVLQDIFRLFIRRNFPSDSLIMNKSKLIEKTLEKYVSGSTYCYNNCGGNDTRGTCEPTKYFKFGICKCKPGWTGPNCDTVEPAKILHGTICGFDRSFMRINCHGVRPWDGCPIGWAKHSWSTDLTVCYKDRTEIGNPVHGTLCGLHSSQIGMYPFQHNIGCNTTTKVLTDKCPLDYESYKNHIVTSCSSSGKFNACVRMNAMCVAINAQEHLPGTLCGIQIQHTINGPTCDGFNPGLSQCPPEYALQYTAFNDLGFMVCVKK